jgi:hypothetical protein
VEWAVQLKKLVFFYLFTGVKKTPLLALSFSVVTIKDFLAATGYSAGQLVSAYSISVKRC